MGKKKPDLSFHLNSLLKISHVELEEILSNIRNLSDKHDKLITILLEEDSVYTKNSCKLNKSSLSRVLGMKPKDIEEMLYACQKEFAR